MKKSLGLIAALAVLASCLTSCASTNKNIAKQRAYAESLVEEYGEYDTVLVYGILDMNPVLNNISFYQPDSRKPASVINHVGAWKPDLFSGSYTYYGVALADTQYVLGESMWWDQYTVGRYVYTTYYNNYNVLGQRTYFDFKTPKENGKIVYLGMKNEQGKDVVNPRGNISLEDYELKQRIKALKALKKDYAGTDWEAEIDNEIKLLGGE